MGVVERSALRGVWNNRPVLPVHGTLRVFWKLPALVLYEYPFNESIRTMLRLERLFDRLAELVRRDTAIDHHFALATMFEVMEVASRADLKSELLKELERHRSQLVAYRGHPGIRQSLLDEVIARVERAYQALNDMQGKAGQALSGHDWLMSVRSRIAIPGGTCEFDLPAYHAWLQSDGSRRRNDLLGWTRQFTPLSDAIAVLIGLLRDSGSPQRMVAVGGHYQQGLSTQRSYQMLRLRVDDSDGLVPEITAHRLQVSVRMTRPDAEGRLRPAAVDTPFELTLCA